MQLIRFFLIFLIFLINPSCNKKELEILSLKINFQEGDLPTVHPHDMMVYLRGISIGKCLYEGLTRIDAKGNADLAGASKLETGKEGLEYKFTIRENHFSDGTKITAYHFENSFKEALSSVSACPRPDLLYMIKNSFLVKAGKKPLEELGVKALDEKTLLIELERPSPHFLELLAQPLCAPLKDPKERKVEAFSGPFMVSKWNRNAKLTLKPNPYFWNRKEVKIPQIDIVMVEEPETLMTLYEQKELDWIGVPLSPLSSEQLQYFQGKNEIRSEPISRVFWIFLNTKHPVLSNTSIRKALGLSIDRTDIATHVFIGSSPLNKPLPLSLLNKDPQDGLGVDIEKAKVFLENGLKELSLTKDALPPLIITYSQQANRKLLAEYLQQCWRSNLGIEIELMPQEWNVLRTNLANGDFEISGAYEASFYHDPLEVLERMATLNSANFSKWTHPKYKEKIESAALSVDVALRTDFLSEAETILIEEMPFIPITSDCFFFAHNPKLKGYVFDSVGAIDFSYASME